MSNDDNSADAGFDLFMATITYADLTPWEKRAYTWHHTAHGTKPYDQNLEADIAAYKARKEGKAA